MVGAGSGEAFVPWLAKLKQSIGIAPSLSAVGVTREHLPRLAVVDLDDPATATLDGLVGQILKACGNHVSVPRGAALSLQRRRTR